MKLIETGEIGRRRLRQGSSSSRTILHPQRKAKLNVDETVKHSRSDLFEYLNNQIYFGNCLALTSQASQVFDNLKKLYFPLESRRQQVLTFSVAFNCHELQ